MNNRCRVCGNLGSFMCSACGPTIAYCRCAIIHRGQPDCKLLPRHANSPAKLFILLDGQI